MSPAIAATAAAIARGNGASPQSLLAIAPARAQAGAMQCLYTNGPIR
jgi:hypothetical protein